MGGNAAKERRRLKRLEQLKQVSEELASKSDDTAKGDSTQTESKTPPKVSGTKRKGKDSQNLNADNTNNKNNAAKRRKHTSPQKENDPTTQSTKKKKVTKKPKHLNRKLQAAQKSDDPILLKKLQEQQDKLDAKKNDRISKFREKVIKMIGGIDHFDEDAYNKMMKGGGAKLETILKAVKKDDAAHDDNIVAPTTELDEGMTVEKTETSTSHDKEDHDQADTLPLHEDETKPEGRTRGRRRRGRKAADAKREEHNKQQVIDAEKMAEQNEEQEKSSSSDVNTETQRSKDTRRCKGRKPVTDFELGKYYSGTIKYVKPYLGIFVDIGCHSDAFCHLSCLTDNHIEDASMFSAGETLEKVCVTSIDRKQKRITISLKTNPTVDKEVIGEKRKVKYDNGGDFGTNETSRVEQNDTNQQEPYSYGGYEEEQQYDEQPQASDTLTPAELKRRRKLERRAERRRQKELTGISA